MNNGCDDAYIYHRAPRGFIISHLHVLDDSSNIYLKDRLCLEEMSYSRLHSL